MNNGKMTFRFDTAKDKDGQAPQEIGPAGGLGTARDYSRTVRREAAAPLEVGSWPYAPIIDVIPEEPYDGEDLSRTYGSPQTSFFRPEPADDLWERSSRRDSADVPEEEPGFGSRYPELTPDSEPGDYGDISYSGLNYGGAYHTRRPTHWWKFALSVAGALGTGLLLGYAALNFISGVNGDSSSGQSPAAAQVQNSTTGSGQPVAGDTRLPNTGSESAVGRIPVAVAAQSYYLLQYGVFSTASGAQQAQQELLAAGLAAGFDPEDGNRVYAGMSPDREQAKLLSSGLKNQGIELYVREVTLPAAEQAAYAGSAEAVNNYFAASGKLLNELSSLSASLLSGTGGAADTAAASDLHMQWTEAVKALQPGLTADGQSLCAGLEKSMSQGIAALNEYNKNQAQGLLWEVQEAMMSFLEGQKKLLTLMM